jgi:hypothetical protein
MIVLRMPEGVTLSVNAYLRSDKQEIDVKVCTNGLVALTEEQVSNFTAEKFVAYQKLDVVADDWRMMTVAEINQYMMEEKADREAREREAAETEEILHDKLWG